MGGDSGLCNMHFNPEECVEGNHWTLISGVLEPLRKLLAEDGAPSTVSQRTLITQILTGHCTDLTINGNCKRLPIKFILLCIVHRRGNNCTQNYSKNACLGQAILEVGANGRIMDTEI
jgi:hypothetical protein